MPALPKAARIKNTVMAKKTTTKALLVVSVFISSNTPFFFISVIISRCILKISLCKREHPSRRGGGILFFRKSPVPAAVFSKLRRDTPFEKGDFRRNIHPSKSRNSVADFGLVIALLDAKYIMSYTIKDIFICA